MKKIIKIVLVAIFVGYGIYINQEENNMTDLALANVEALADGENTGKQYTCYKTISSGNSGAQTSDVRYCGSCSIQPANYYSGDGVCNNR